MPTMVPLFISENSLFTRLLPMNPAWPVTSMVLLFKSILFIVLSLGKSLLFNVFILSGAADVLFWTVSNSSF